MKVEQKGYYIEKSYDTSVFEDSKQLARDRFNLQVKRVPTKDVYKTVGSMYVTIRVDLRNMNRIHDVGVEVIHG